MAVGASGRGERYRWTILGVGVVAQAALSAVQQGLPALGPALRDEFGLSLPETGVVFSVFGWGVLLTLLLWGALADRIGERTVISSGLTGAAVALVLAASADGMAGLLVWLGIAGASGASAAAASGRAVMGWFGRAERGTALGIRQMAVPLGGAVAALTLPHLGVDGALLALAGGCAVGAAAAARWLREPPPAPPSRPKVDAPPPLRDGRVWRLSVGSALLVCAQVVLVAFIVLFLHDEHGLSVGQAAVALAVVQIGGAVARVWAGRRSDRAGRRIAPLRRYGLAVTAALLGAAALADGPLVALLPVLVLAGVLSMSWNGLSFTAAAEMAGRERAGTALGLQGTVIRLPTTVAAIAFGALVTETSWSAGFAVLALAPLAGWVLLRPLVAEEEGRIARRERRIATQMTTGMTGATG